MWRYVPNTTLRWELRRASEYLPNRGLGFWWSGGSLGTEVGDDRKNMSLVFCVLILRWQYELALAWKA